MKRSVFIVQLSGGTIIYGRLTEKGIKESVVDIFSILYTYQ